MKKKKATIKYVLNSRLKARLNEKEEETFPLYIQVTYNGKVTRFPYPFKEEEYLTNEQFLKIESNKDYQYYHSLSSKVLDFETENGTKEEINFSNLHSKILIYSKNFNQILIARAAFILMEFAKDKLTYREYQATVNFLEVAGIREKDNEVHVSIGNSLLIIAPFLGILSELKFKLSDEVNNAMIAFIVGHFFERAIQEDKIKIVSRLNLFSWRFIPELKKKLEYFSLNQIVLDADAFNLGIEMSGKSDYKFDMKFFKDNLSNYLVENENLNYFELIDTLIKTSSTYLDLEKKNLTAF